MDITANVGQTIVPPDATAVVRAPGRPPEPSPSAEAPATAQSVTAERASPAVERLELQRRANAPDSIRISVDEPTKRFVAQILNDANEVIKQIPPEDSLRAAARFRAITGLLFDSRG